MKLNIRPVNRLLQLEKLIDDTISADKGARFREFSKQHFSRNVDAFRGIEKQRTHMGASGIGDFCERRVWLRFRWGLNELFSGRILRLFNRGHMEESRFHAMLEVVGVKLHYTDTAGKQIGFKAAYKHFAGSVDAIITDVPTLEQIAQLLLECKTHNNKSFTDLEKKGVRVTKPVYYFQIQTYLKAFNLTHCLYMGVNKNTDAIYIELIELDEKDAESMHNKAHRLVFTPNIPRGLSTNPSYFECKMCSMHGICHKNEPLAVNCRTCARSVPLETGEWACLHENILYPLSTQQQMQGCVMWSVVK